MEIHREGLKKGRKEGNDMMLKERWNKREKGRRERDYVRKAENRSSEEEREKKGKLMGRNGGNG